MSNDDENWLFDHTTSLGNGHDLGWSIGPGGEAWPVIINRAACTEATPVAVTAEAFRQIAPHENDGELRSRFRVVFCGAVTHSGKPCRNRRGHCQAHEKPGVIPKSDERQLW